MSCAAFLRKLINKQYNVTRGNFTASSSFSACQTKLAESRPRKTTELKLFARARELADSDPLMEVIDGGNCNSVVTVNTARGTGSNFHVPRYEGWTRSETYAATSLL